MTNPWIVKPRATIRTRERYKTLPGTGKDGKRIKVHTGSEIVRTATCTKHGLPSHAFEGVNDAGWLFLCKNVGEEEPHRFIAEPPKEPPL